MTIFSYVYLAVFVVAVAVLIYVRTQLVFAARPNHFFQWFYWAAAVMIGIFTVLTSRTPADYISGFFITGMLGLFGFWRNGITPDSLITRIGAVRGLDSLTALHLSVLPTGLTELAAMAGSVTIAKLRFKQSPAVIKAFLDKKTEPARVIIDQ
ncbi:hypothetical protein [Lacticaseibacillus camelliae]|uniref:Uncharacterized protein n=1 Tax=Lacticaseibacillus camelliae DSM 22697 = JCM 13995 TaxID=1423730 RepID=A0A0R2FAF0_9LACO|nr:hypothetical protein [Lacticaseibacillus camelliae]KRN25346.1 hypothetical protein FC75_GL000616 [Lacticaseibacillus camelliae DSM 22697 = JCM 13995]